MVNYICTICGKNFSQKSHYNSHINKKNLCQPINEKIINNKINEKLEELSKNGDVEIKNLKVLNYNNNNIEMSKIGKNRDIKDQFYTKRYISEKCINDFIELLNINKDNSLILEPSAGNGAFSDYFINNNYNINAFDIEPKKDYIKKQDFLELDIENYKKINKKIYCIGNPPFGRQSSLARQFIKKLTTFCDVIGFILPKSFRKDSFKSTFPLCYHLEKEYDIDNKAFTINEKEHDVPCIFQIWILRDYNRYVKPKEDPYGFHWIKKPIVEQIGTNNYGKPIKKHIFEQEPDFGVLRAGGGDTCGRLSEEYLDGVKCYQQGWLFIKLDEKYDKNKFKEEYNKIDFDDSNVGMKSINKTKFTEEINKILRSMD